MKLFKNVLTALAFAFAVTAAFAFTSPKNAATGMIDVEAKDPLCTPAQVSDKCVFTSGLILCQANVLGKLYPVVPDGQTCDQPSLYRNE